MSNGVNGTTTKKLYGKYRGIVASNIDPLFQGRLLVQVPDVLADDPCIWALPAVPVAGTQMGIFALPPINSGVWVEFERGDSQHAVWVGCWAASLADLPALSLVPPPPVSNFVLQTLGQNTLVMSDLPAATGGIMLKSKTGAFVIVNDTGIYLSNGKGATISLLGTTVVVNQGALVIK